jgi:nitric oxide reductase NorD protein
VSFSAERGVLQFYLAGFGLQDIELNARHQHHLNAPLTRLTISSGSLLFPDSYPPVVGAANGDIYRAAAAHAMAHLLYSPRHQPVLARKPLLIAVLSLIEDARVECLMSRSWPGLGKLWGCFHVASGAAGDLEAPSLLARLARSLHDPAYLDSNHWVNKGRELFDAHKEGANDTTAFVEIASILANDLGQMRVRFDPERYRVEPAYRDDNSFLWEFSENQQSAPPDEILGRTSGRMAVGAGGAGDEASIAAIAPTDARTWHYPEWDYRAEIERDKWVTVLDSSATVVSQNPVSVRAALRRTRMGMGAPVLDPTVRLRRQAEGDEVDLDAAIECRICHRALITPDFRIYRRLGRRRQRVAILLLLDLSESTNDRVGDTYTTVLDIEKRAAVLAADLMNQGQGRLAIHGFASNGRNQVHYTRIKDFDESFADLQRQRLTRQRGALSTRMGAALRHARTSLAFEEAEKKMIILVTDGEPSDIDVYDRRYLIEDARHAVATLQDLGIKAFCLTLDQRADAYVRAVFGEWNYLIVGNPESLPVRLAQSFARAAAR